VGFFLENPLVSVGIQPGLKDPFCL
jgi:hypothetical protein